MRKAFLKRMMSVLVASVLLVSGFSFIAKADEAVPFYNNVNTSNSCLHTV